MEKYQQRILFFVSASGRNKYKNMILLILSKKNFLF